MNQFTIAKCTGGVNNTVLQPWNIDPPSLVKKLSKPTIGNKDGSYFLRCSGNHRSTAGTDDIAHVLILDGDSRIDADGVIRSGAPAPAKVSKILTNLWLSHIIYSSHSNAATPEEITAKGNDSGGAYGADYYKYRVVIPCQYTPEQLPALLDHLFSKLHHYGVMLAPVTENKTWAQPWYFPRVPDAKRVELFEIHQHTGDILDVDGIYSTWEQSRQVFDEPKPLPYKPQPNENLTGWRNPIKEFNQSCGVHDVLIRNGYTKKGQKYLRPDSSSKIASVQICQNCLDGVERVFSHGGDILNDKHAHDAFDCYLLLEADGNNNAALNWNPELTKHNQRMFKQDEAKKKAALIQQPEPDQPYVDNEPMKEQASTFNATLDTEHKYCNVDLLRRVDDSHLLKRLSKQAAAETHLPVNTVFIIGMTVYSSMAARKYSVLYPNGRQLPIGLYSVVEQPSGTGKSWCMGTFQNPFYDIHKAVVDDVLKQIKQFDKRLSDGEELNEAEKTEHEELQAQSKRLNTGLFVSNATPEGLEKTLTHTNGFFSAISSEQGLFNSLLGCSYKSSENSNNNDVVLNGFDGGHVNSVRVTRVGYNGNVIGAVACFAQQGSIETVLKASNGTGLSERFLMLAEPHSLGKRDHTKSALHDDKLTDEYAKSCQFIEHIIKSPREFEGLSNLIISKKGHFKINQYRNRIEPHLVDGGKFSHISLRGAASKINMQIMKIAANLHLIDSGEYVPEIADKHVDAAIDIANELLEANLKLCKDKGIMGMKAEFTAILSLFENDQRPRTRRNIIQSKCQKIPFKDFSGNKSALIKTTLDEMVEQKLLTKIMDAGKAQYILAQ